MNASQSDIRRSSIIAWSLSLGIIGIVLLLFRDGCVVSSTAEAARPVQCKHNLKQIMLALHNYHDAHGSFPPAYVVDADGKRMHSWRTLLLPYLEGRKVYEEYRMDEPWDSDHNREVALNARTSSPVHRCPSDTTRSGPDHYAEPNYLAVVGANTMWPGTEALSLHMVSDGTDATIMLVEVVGSGIDIFEPRDLEFDQLSFHLNEPDRASPSSMHQTKTKWPWQTPERYVNVAFVDGSVKSLPQSTPPETLKALLTINGGEATEGF